MWHTGQHLMAWAPQWDLTRLGWWESVQKKIKQGMKLHRDKGDFKGIKLQQKIIILWALDLSQVEIEYLDLL